MRREPYASAGRVFWTVDSGAGHRGQRWIDRPEGHRPNLVLVHLLTDASRLNQIGPVFFSMLQRRVLRPEDYETLAVLAHPSGERRR